MKAKKGDYIRILSRRSASWLENNEIYCVGDIIDETHMVVNGNLWAHIDNDYEIVYQFSDYLKQIEQLVNK